MKISAGYKLCCAHLFFQGRLPVLVAVLLQLSPDLHRMVGVGLGQGLGGVQAQVDVTRLRTNQRRLLSVSSQSNAVIISQQPIRGRYLCPAWPGAEWSTEAFNSLCRDLRVCKHEARARGDTQQSVMGI